MFERYTEKSRRVIFFARYEASQYGSACIESEHLLLGLLRENTTLLGRLLNADAVKSIRGQVDDRTPVRETSTSVDLPLSPESKRVLAFAAEESERQGHGHIGVLHLLAGLVQDETSSGGLLLNERGLGLAAVREELCRGTPEGSGGARTVRSGTNITFETGPHNLSLPDETLAELTRRAQAKGVEVQSLLRSLLDNALGAQASGGPVVASGVPLKETYQRLRSQIEAEGWAGLDATQLEEEQARRKGMGRK